MAISIFNHETAKRLGFEKISSGSSYPAECWDRSYEGAVLETYEVNGRDDSDFYAIVWDEAEQRTRTIEYASTRGWTYFDGAKVDATEEVKAKALAYERAQIRSALKDGTTRKLRGIHKGGIAIVARGRKVPKGTSGHVASISKKGDGYRTEDWLMLITDAGAIFVRAANCDPVVDEAAVSSGVHAALLEFDSQPFHLHSFRSAPFAQMHAAGIDVDRALSR